MGSGPATPPPKGILADENAQSRISEKVSGGHCGDESRDPVGRRVDLSENMGDRKELEGVEQNQNIGDYQLNFPRALPTPFDGVDNRKTVSLHFDL